MKSHACTSCFYNFLLRRLKAHKNSFHLKKENLSFVEKPRRYRPEKLKINCSTNLASWRKRKISHDFLFRSLPLHEKSCISWKNLLEKKINETQRSARFSPIARGGERGGVVGIADSSAEKSDFKRSNWTAHL